MDQGTAMGHLRCQLALLLRAHIDSPVLLSTSPSQSLSPSLLCICILEAWIRSFHLGQSPLIQIRCLPRQHRRHVPDRRPLLRHPLKQILPHKLSQRIALDHRLLKAIDIHRRHPLLVDHSLLEARRVHYRPP